MNHGCWKQSVSKCWLNCNIFRKFWLLPKDWLRVYALTVLKKIFFSKMRAAGGRFPIGNIIKLPKFIIKALFPQLMIAKKIILHQEEINSILEI